MAVKVFAGKWVVVVLRSIAVNSAGFADKQAVFELVLDVIERVVAEQVAMHLGRNGVVHKSA